jgi:hypothetical protein
VIVVRHNYISARDRQSRGKGKPPKLAAVGRALAHVKYIQHRPGEDRLEGGREFFDDSEEGLDSNDLRKAIKELKDSRVVVHKITLAPEINPEDKKQFTREVMEQLGREKGLDLKWMAVEHNNTDHHHIHVVVLGKDKNGTDVRIDKKDYDKIKEYGDRYLERWHPLELERAREERERRERERMDARKKEREAERDQRIREGLELPFIHKKIVREMLEPYDEWKKKQASKELEPAKNEPKEEIEKPYFQDTIQAAGKEWSKQNTLAELRELNEYLWDNYDERIPTDEYKKLVGWMKDKERLGEREPAKGEEKKEQPAVASDEKKDKDAFDYKGQKYSKDDSYEKLAGLSRQLAEADKKDRLSVEDYQKLRGWIENADRARWSGVLEKQMDIAKTQEWQGKARAGDPNNYRYVDPVQQELMANPVVGLYLQGASIAAQLVKWIPLDDRNRDYNKEALEHLEELKRNKLKEYAEPGRDPEKRQQDLEALEALNKAIELNKESRAKEEEEKKNKERRKPDPFAFDEWGRF